MALSVIQGTNGVTSGTQLVLTFNSPTTANNLVVIGVGYNAGATTVISVNDTAGNTYGTSTTRGTTAASSAVQYYAVQNTGGATAGTIRITPTNTQLNGFMIEVSGNATTNVTDVSSVGTGNSTTPSVSSFTTTKANSIVVANYYMNAVNANPTPGAGYSIQTGANNNRGAIEHKILSATSSETAPVTGTNSTQWSEVAANYAAPSGGAGTNLIQSTGTAVLGLGSTSVSWGASTTTGNLIVVGVALTNAAVLGTVSNVTDNQGNMYQKAIAGTISTVSDVLNVELWYAANIVGGAGSVTVSHTVDNCALFAREYSGFNTLDVTSSASGSSTTPNSGTSAITSVATELVVVATGDDKGSSQTWTAAGNYGDMVGTATTLTGISMEDTLVSATGAQTGTLTLGNAANWDSLLATFKNVSTSSKQSFTTLLNLGNI